MPDSQVAITPGSGANIDTRTEDINGDHRQVVTIGDPDAGARVAAVTAGGALRVDGSAATQPVSGTVTANAGSGTFAVSGPLTDAQLRATAVPVSGTVTITDGSGPVTVDGGAANGAAVSGNPVLVGGSDGTNARSIATDTSGRQVVVAPDRSASISIAANSTSSGSVTGITDGGVAMVQLTGTWSATVQIQVTIDGTNWINVTGSTSIINEATGAYIASGNLTANGIYQIDVAGLTGVRVITTAYTSGTVTGTIRVSTSTGIVGVQGVPTVAQSGTWTVGVTGYPTAAAAADAFANPTITHIGADGFTFNGATWERNRSGVYTVNVDTSSARVASGTGTAFINYSGRSLLVWINVTAVTGTTPTATFRLQWSPDNGTTWIDWDTTNLQTTSITGVTTATLRVGPSGITTAANAARADIVPRQVRLAWTIGGTTPSFTFASWFTSTQ